MTPDELGAAWDGGKVHLPLRSDGNGRGFGRPDAGVDRPFDVGQVIAPAARTRRLGTRTMIGSGPVSNRDRAAGCAGIAEKRTLELLEPGQAITPFMRCGDRIRLDILGPSSAINRWRCYETVRLLSLVGGVPRAHCAEPEKYSL